MKPLAIFREKDVFPEKNTPEENIQYEDRLTGKAVVFDNEEKIALVGNKVNTFYILPGGGIEPEETIEDGIVRECLEEIGCHVELDWSLGIIEDYRPRDKKHYISHCYIARLTGEKGDPLLTAEERKNGLHVLWVTLDEAILILENETEQLKNGEVAYYNTGFNILRDAFFLRELKTVKT